MSNLEKPKNLTEKQCVTIMCKIATLLNGVSVCQARYILNEARHIIYECHSIDTNNPRFKAKLGEFAKSGVCFDGPCNPEPVRDSEWIEPLQ